MGRFAGEKPVIYEKFLTIFKFKYDLPLKTVLPNTGKEVAELKPQTPVHVRL